MANLLQFGEKNFHIQLREHAADVGVNTIGKHRVKKRTHLRGRFCFHIREKYDGKIIKWFFFP